MHDETQRVLEMLQGGRITPAQAAELLAALDGSARTTPAPEQPRTLRINVSDAVTGRVRVNVNIPLSLVSVASRLGMSLGIKHAPELADIDFAQIMDALRDGARGKIIDVVDDDDRQHVVVSVD